MVATLTSAAPNLPCTGWLTSFAGSAKAAGTLAYFLITGKQGVPLDAPRGVALSRKSMASNEMLGHYPMGVAMVTGSGVAENPAEGWYQISLAQRMDNQQRCGQPAEIAPVYVMLASDEASYVSGARIAVTGGKPIL